MHNQTSNVPDSGEYHPVYRVYVGDNLVYPDKMNGAKDALDLPYNITVQYQFIDDHRSVPPNWTGAYIDTTTVTITIETAMPCFVYRQTDFSDYKDFFDLSKLPHINVSDALVIAFPNVVRGSCREYYYWTSRRPYYSHDELSGGPGKIQGFPFAGRISERDSMFIHKTTELEHITYNQQGVPSTPYYETKESLYYITPSTYSNVGGRFAWSGSFTQKTNAIDSFFIERYVHTTLNGGRHTFYKSPTSISPNYLIENDSQIGLAITGATTCFVSDGVNIHQLDPQNPVCLYKPFPDKFIFTSTGSSQFDIVCRHIYGPYYRYTDHKITATTTDERVLQRLQLYPDAEAIPFCDNLSKHGYFESAEFLPRWKYTGGLYGNLEEIWPEDWDEYTYPLVPLAAANDRAYCPARDIYVYYAKMIPFYEIYNGEVVVPNRHGLSCPQKNTYQILENNNPAYSSYSEWLADVTTPGHDPKPPT